MLLLERISNDIASICHKLDCCFFLNEELRARLRAELSSLLKMRQSYETHEAKMAVEKRGTERGLF